MNLLERRFTEAERKALAVQIAQIKPKEQESDESGLVGVYRNHERGGWDVWVWDGQRKVRCGHTHNKAEAPDMQWRKEQELGRP